MPRLAALPAVLAALTLGCSAQTFSTIASAIAAAAEPPPAGSVHEDVFMSNALGVRKHAVIYLPPSYATDTTRRYPVVYYLHGLSGTETDWASKGSIDIAADSLFARGTPEMIIVLPDGDDGWYTTWTTQVGFRACADTLRTESADRYCVRQQRYDEYIARDLVRYIDSRYRTVNDAGRRGIAGLSMGGYGALSIALKYPDVFSAAASHSGVVSPLYAGPRPFVAPPRYATTVEELRPTTGTFWSRYQLFWGTDLDRWRAADPARLAESLRRRGGRMPALFFDCGVDDGYVDQNRALHDELTRLQITHTYAEWPGAHTWRYWSTHVRESLVWLGKEVGR
ncbi:MAG TPA: alpha/beta hydrolase family protein [Gemmatimonadaceae bacterium]